MSSNTESVFDWDCNDVGKYLEKNNIRGCGPALMRNNINGRAFLNLDKQAMANWGISMVTQTKILVLLKGLDARCPQNEILLSQSTSRNKLVPSTNSKMTASPLLQTLSSITPAPCTPAFINNAPPSFLHGKTPVTPKRNLKPVVAAKSTMPPALPPKPNHLRPTATNISSSINGSKFSAQHVINNASKEKYEKPISNFGTKHESLIKTSPPPAEVAVDDMINYDSFSSDPEEFSEEDANLADVDDENYEVVDHHSPDESEKKPCIASNGRDTINVGLFSKFYTPRTAPSDPVKPGSGESVHCPPIPPARSKAKNGTSSHTSSQSSLASESSVLQSPDARKSSSVSLERDVPWMKSSLSSLTESVPMNSPPPLPLPNIISAKSKSSSTQSLMSSRPALNNESQFVSRPPSSCDSGSSNESDVNIQPWYFNIERRQAESCLTPCRDGTFIIRPSKHGGQNSPFTLSLQYNQRVFHVLIRRRTDGLLALGTEKPGEDTFSSLTALVQSYQREPIHLHAGSKLAGTTRLTQWPENISFG